MTDNQPTENQILLEKLLLEHNQAEEQRVLSRWDRIWSDYLSYSRINGIYSETFPNWAKTSKYSLNDKL